MVVLNAGVPCAQFAMQVLTLFSCSCVHDNSSLGCPVQRFPDKGQLLSLVVAVLNLVIEIGAIEAVDMLARLLQRQLYSDVSQNLGRSCGRGGKNRNIRAQRTQQTELAVIRSEIVPPLGYTMSFINGKQRDRSRLHPVLKTRFLNSFGRKIEQE